ncbi:mannose-6-phosphate isomerase, class I [Microtetraspora sp. NBRC 13810]|uniref:mannose-6-phosphate isomerase, class I n=1 Tax=Microtetraspora sp. NBRC 13810 TaxID=3030990 RepID=UPI0024A50E03|nr:mannose-6-phosphate isomerase, class I [Microtetraspora sp. NBRC 13810]GLW10887.1 mannose-6-phosphate isomerase, class I [Microtetraspora sp. NBRC 13810]
MTAVLPMTNPVRPYAWGSRVAIAALQGRAPAAEPEAELWMGAHPAAPSVLATPGGPVPLGELVAADPAGTLGAAALAEFGPRLPYLLKVLAADEPLSLQVHPAPEQAAEGYAREDAAGIPLEAADRNYRDPYAKPELICALEPFEALSGFQEPARSAARLAGLGVPALGPAVELLAAGRLHAVVSELLTLPAAERAPLVADVTAACARDAELAWAAGLAGHYPGDPGVVIALLMHRVRLAPGEAMYVPAGQPHSYLSGTGVEIMGASDNVLRGGLTGKHIDVPELLRILSPEASEPALVHARDTGSEEVYDTPAREFRLSRIPLDGPVTLPAAGPQILLSVAGEVSVRRAGGQGEGTTEHRVPPGNSVFVPASAGPLELSGEGTLFRAATGGGERA